MMDEKLAHGLYWVKWERRSRWSMGWFVGSGWCKAQISDRGFEEGRAMPEPFLVHSRVEQPDHVSLDHEPGLYWVKFRVNDDWRPAEYRDDGEWYVIGDEMPHSNGLGNDPPAVVGKPLTPPGLDDDLRVALSLRRRGKAA